MTMPRVYGYARFRATQSCPSNMHFSCLLQVFGQVFIISSVWNHCYDFFCFLIVYGDFMIINSTTVFASITLKVTDGFCWIWCPICKRVFCQITQSFKGCYFFHFVWFWKYEVSSIRQPNEDCPSPVLGYSVIRSSDNLDSYLITKAFEILNDGILHHAITYTENVRDVFHNERMRTETIYKTNKGLV